MNESTPEKDPKIIVDEDWKSQVQAEKEAAKEASPETAGAAGGEAAESASHAPPMPEASFSVLATTLATQALIALGQTPEPQEEQVPVNLDFAKHCIDTLDMLEQKTQGNLTAEETELVTRFLHELRMLFVAVKTQVEKNPTPESPIVKP